MSNKSWTFGFGKEEAIIDRGPVERSHESSASAYLRGRGQHLRLPTSFDLYLMSAFHEITIHVDGETEVRALVKSTASVLPGPIL